MLYIEDISISIMLYIKHYAPITFSFKDSSIGFKLISMVLIVSIVIFIISSGLIAMFRHTSFQEKVRDDNHHNALGGIMLLSYWKTIMNPVLMKYWIHYV